MNATKKQNKKTKKVKSVVRGVQVVIICEAEGCSNERLVRVADIKRGTGRFCCKSCASKNRELIKKGLLSADAPHVTYLKSEEDRAKLPSDLNVKIGKPQQ